MKNYFNSLKHDKVICSWGWNLPRKIVLESKIYMVYIQIIVNEQIDPYGINVRLDYRT